MQCQPGTAIQAIFTEDGLWYPAQIVEQTSDGYKIQFEEVEDPSEVAFDQIRLVEENLKNIFILHQFSGAPRDAT